MEDAVLQQLLDDRNKSFWDEIHEVFVPTVLLCESRHYAFHLFEKKAQFFVPVSNLSKEAFTHELMHIWLRSKNIFITNFLLNRLREEPLLYWSFTDNMFEQLGYWLEHVKMLPYFIGAGFKKEKFTEDYDQYKCSPMHWQIMLAGMSNPSKKVPLPCLDLYVSRFFAMKTCCNEWFDYTPYFEAMQNIRPELFQILDRFWNLWLQFDIERYDPVACSYKPFTAQLMHDLGKWAVEAIHTRQNKSAAA